MSAAAVPLDAWEGRPLAEWRALWQVPELLVFARLGSTNDVLRSRAAAGAPASTVAIADQQTAGRGQRGRSWTALPGKSLLMSVLLRPPTCGALGAAPLRVGLAVAHAIQEVSGIAVRIKWPNDIVANDRKLGGILCEAVTTGADTSIIAGIGINCLQENADFPPELAATATSIVMIAGRTVARAALAGAIVRALDAVTSCVADPLSDAELSAFAARDALRGRAITIDDVPAGTAAGIDAAGALRVESSAGIIMVHTGTVRVARARDAAHERAQ